MKVTFANNTLTVVTGIKKELIESGIQLVAKDEKGNDIYRVGVNKHGSASIDNYSIIGNSYTEDGVLQAVILVNMDKTEDQIKREFGDALLAAAKYIPEILESAEDKAAAVTALFQ